MAAIIQHSKKKNQQPEKSVTKHGHLVSPARDEKQPNNEATLLLSLKKTKHMYVAGTYMIDVQ